MVNVIITDDQEQNRYLLEALLKGNGYAVRSASNGRDALNLARSSPPDLIISDILMPVMDGFTLCREWKNDDRLMSVPFIFFTATYTEPKDEAFGLSLGAKRYLVKPMEPELLWKSSKRCWKAGVRPGRMIRPPERFRKRACICGNTTKP